MINFRNKNIKFIAIMAVLLGIFAVGYFYYQGKELETPSPSVVQEPQKDAEVIVENLNIP